MAEDYERLKAQHKVLCKELELASNLLADVYMQVGNHRPPTIRHALTPGLRDGIRDFLHARKTIAAKPTYDDLRNIIEDLYGAFEVYMDQLEAALVDGNVADAMVLVMEMNDIIVWLKARVREADASRNGNLEETDVAP